MMARKSHRTAVRDTERGFRGRPIGLSTETMKGVAPIVGVIGGTNDGIDGGTGA